MKHTVRAEFVPVPKGHEAQQPRTPMCGAGSLVAIVKGEMKEVITVRTYYNEKGSGMQPVRACVWMHGNDYRSGRGQAGGCGYHKESQAIADAVSSAGVKLYGTPYSREPSDLKKPFDLGGTGSSGYEEIFKAIARTMGHRGRMVWVSHGL